MKMVNFKENHLLLTHSIPLQGSHHFIFPYLSCSLSLSCMQAHARTHTPTTHTHTHTHTHTYTHTHLSATTHKFLCRCVCVCVNGCGTVSVGLNLFFCECVYICWCVHIQVFLVCVCVCVSVCVFSGVLITASETVDPDTGLSSTLSRLQYIAGKEDAAARFSCAVTDTPLKSTPVQLTINCDTLTPSTDF